MSTLQSAAREIGDLGDGDAAALGRMAIVLVPVILSTVVVVLSLFLTNKANKDLYEHQRKLSQEEAGSRLKAESRLKLLERDIAAYDRLLRAIGTYATYVYAVLASGFRVSEIRMAGEADGQYLEEAHRMQKAYSEGRVWEEMESSAISAGDADTAEMVIALRKIHGDIFYLLGEDGRARSKGDDARRQELAPRLIELINRAADVEKTLSARVRERLNGLADELATV